MNTTKGSFTVRSAFSSAGGGYLPSSIKGEKPDTAERRRACQLPTSSLNEVHRNPALRLPTHGS